MNLNNQHSLDQMPEYLSTQHLIQLGIYPSIESAYQARINGFSPPYIKLRHKIMYEKQALIKFLESRMHPREKRRVNSHE